MRRLTRALRPRSRSSDVELIILDELDNEVATVPDAAIDRLRASIIEEREHLQADVRDRIEGFDIDKVRKRAVSMSKPSVRSRLGLQILILDNQRIGHLAFAVDSSRQLDIG